MADLSLRPYASQFPPPERAMRSRGNEVSSTNQIDTKVYCDTGRRRRAQFVRERTNGEPAKVVARKTGLSVPAVYNLRNGRNEISFGALNNWIDSDPGFADDFAALIKTDPYTASGAAKPEAFKPAEWSANETGCEAEEQEAAMRALYARMGRGG